MCFHFQEREMKTRAAQQNVVNSLSLARFSRAQLSVSSVRVFECKCVSGGESEEKERGKRIRDV